MVSGSVLIISETPPCLNIHFPTVKDKYIWMKPIPDGSFEYYEATITGWVKVLNIPAYAPFDHTHPQIDHIPDIVALLTSGVTGQKVLGGYKFTFNHGVLTGFESV